MMRAIGDAGFRGSVIGLLAIVTSLVHLSTPVVGAWSELRVVSLGLYAILTILLNPLAKDRPEPWRSAGLIVDLGMIGAMAAITVWMTLTYEDFISRTGYPTDLDLLAGLALTVCVVEATRRSLGWPMVILVIAFIGYTHWGQMFPGVFAHAGARWDDIVEFIFRDSAGIYGTPVAVMAGYVILFIIMGSILEASGAGEVLLDFSRAVTGRTIAGPAKIAIVSSACMGTISGSAVANVVTTGAFTIPLMRKAGIKPHIAAATEAVASTGGLIMPPVMGAAAFIAAQNAGLSYGLFIVAAAVPAVFYYAALFLMVDMEGRRDGLYANPDMQVPSLREVGRRGWWIPVPFVVLVYLMMAGYSPARSAGIGMALLAVMVIVAKGWRQGLANIVEGLDQGSRGAAALMMAAAAAGIVIAMVHVSGIGLRMTHIVVTLAGGQLLLTLALVALATLVLGMGLPITAAYLTAATLAVPALSQMNVPPLASHMFILYFSAISAITPPVALATFAAAGLAQANFWKTGLYACRLGMTGFIVPFLLIDRPGMLILGQPLGTIAYDVGTAGAGLLAISIAVVGHLNHKIQVLPRLLFVASGIGLAILNDLTIDIVSTLVALAGYLLYRISIPTSGSGDKVVPERGPGY